MDRPEVIVLSGGLDEVSSDYVVTPGSVRRSLNYEVVAEGGYRRIAGMKEWEGGDATARLSAIAVVETVQSTYQTGAGLTSSGGVDHRIVGLIQRETTTLAVVERTIATASFTTGENLVAKVLGNAVTITPEPTIIDADPALTDAERQEALEAAEEVGSKFRLAPEGTGPVVLLAQLAEWVYAVRMDGTQALVQRASPVHAIRWNAVGEITMPDEEPRRWEAVAHRPRGGVDTLYIVNGATAPYAITIDGALSEIDDEVAEAPTHVTAHRSHLFLSYPGGAVLHSGIDNPASFAAIDGAAELTIGRDVTGFQSLPGESLLIASVDRLTILSGTSKADFRLDRYSDTAGALPGTLADMPTAIFADPRGITTLAASDTYGNFTSKTLSQRFDPAFRRITGGADLWALVNREKSQYRLISETGRGLYLTFSAGSLAGGMEVDLGQGITAACSYSGDEDRLFVATTDGFVQRLDAGSTFAREPIDAFLETAQYSYRTPRQKKRFKSAVLEIEGNPALEMTVANSVDSGFERVEDTVPEPIEVEARERGLYRAPLLAPFNQRFHAHVGLVGVGLMQAIRIVPTSTHEHTINSMVVHYTRRGQRR